MKKTLTVLLVMALTLCLVAGFAACEDKSQQIRYLVALDSDGLAFDNLSLGDFAYKSSLDQSGEYPDVSTVGFQVTYEDGSSSAIASNDTDLKVKEIKLDGNVVDSEPELYDVGFWEYIFDYKGYTATVSFTITPSENASYTLSGIPSSWKYSMMPDLTEVATVTGYENQVVFEGENANAELYYISADRYAEIVGLGTLDLDKFYDYFVDFSQYSSDSDYRLPAGEYRIVVRMAASDRYFQQLTNAVSVTVEKEKLTFTPPENVSASYYFTGKMQPGNAKISQVIVPAQSATTTNLAGEQIMLQSLYRSWLDPDEEVSAATPEKTYKFLFEPVNVDASNYDFSALIGECTVTVHRGYLGGKAEEFYFSDDQPLVVNRNVTLDDYTENGFPFFNSTSLTDDAFKLREFFSMVDIKDANGKKLPVYSYETAKEPEIAGDEGASAKLVRTYSNTGVYDYFIILNGDAEFKDYTFTVSLIDDVNFYWGTYSYDYGNAPITLNYTLEKNDNSQGVSYDSYTLTDGKLIFDLYMDYNAYDEALLDTLTITQLDSCTDVNGNYRETTPGLTIDTDMTETVPDATEPQMFRITISVPVTLPEGYQYYYACMKIEMQTKENYKDVSIMTYAELIG